MIEQAYGCATVRGGGGLKVRARLCISNTLTESAWRRGDQVYAGVVPLHRIRHEAPPTDQASLRLSTVRGGVGLNGLSGVERYVLVAASGTRLNDQGACRCCAFATEPP